MGDYDSQPQEDVSTCPVCAHTYPRGVRFCADDGAALISARVSDDRRGRVIGGRFQLGATLGSGGMGVVYEAEQLGVGRRVAVKLLSRERAGKARSRARFLREARTISQLQSPHTVTLIDFGHSDAGEPYLVMERLEGLTLRAELARRGRFEASEAARVVGHIARSLAEAHARGIVHRDLKPENVMLSALPGGEPPHVTVLDFGVARVLEDEEHLTKTSEVPGTSTYQAPELLDGATATPCSDVYALGVIAYELLTGKPPFEGSAWEVMAQHREAHPRDFAEHGVVAPRSLTTLIWRMLAKPPALRPLDGSAVLTALRVHERPAASVATTDETLAGPAVSLSEPAPGRQRARRLVGALTLVGLGIVGGYLLGERATEVGGEDPAPDLSSSVVDGPSTAAPLTISEPPPDAFTPNDGAGFDDRTDAVSPEHATPAVTSKEAHPARRPAQAQPPTPGSGDDAPPNPPIDRERATRIDEMLP